MSMVRVDSSATFSSSSFVTSIKVSVSTLKPLTMSSLATSSPVSASTLAYLMRLPIELVERDLFVFRRGRIERDRTGNEGKTQKAFPVRAGRHCGELHY